MQPQEATKEPMVELDTGGNSVDVELKAEKEVEVEEDVPEVLPPSAFSNVPPATVALDFFLHH